MARELESTFGELGLAQYLDAFVDNGFDTWDTILDIQESDLDALGVKLGHRRKLQRRIANARGIAPSISLASPAKPTPEETKQQEPPKPKSRSETVTEGGGVAKRKYRRHPKPDDRAPERPPSAYVLFSNKMREDLKSQNLTFTEIAKLVGENWQNLPPAEKEAYESQANAAKEKYHRDLVEYKKTPEYRQYAQYLREFKEKQAKQNQDIAKRPKTESARARHGSSSSGTATGNSSIATSGDSRSRSGSERLRGSEPPPVSQERMNSLVSTAESSHGGVPGLTPHSSLDEPRFSPKTSHFDQAGSGLRDARAMRYRDGSHKPLPSLSDVLDDGPPYGSFAPANGRSHMVDGSRNPGTMRGPVPTLRHEPSSNDSVSVASSAGYSRSSGEGPVPIHTLLADRTMPLSQSHDGGSASPTSFPPISEPDRSAYSTPHGPRGYGFQSTSSVLQNMKVEKAGDGDVLMMNSDSLPRQDVGQAGQLKDGFDGMNALLKAGEIVGRRY